jgi:Ca-activated chloride channel family protein
MMEYDNITERDGAGGAQVGGVQARALTLSALPANAYGPAGEPARAYVLFDVRARASGHGARLPLNLSLALDRSGSMEGAPLEYVKRACAYVVDLLEPDDFLSVVAFGEDADVVLPARRVTNKALLKDYIQRIQTGHTTNLSEGLLVACRQIASVKTPGTLNRVLLLSDGGPTAGDRDFASIVGQAGEQKARGITVTTLGLGPDYDEELLSGIARRAGGNFYDVARPELIPDIFRRELDVLARVSARNLRLRLLLARGVSVRQVYGRQPVLGPRTGEASLSDVEQGTGLVSLWELEAVPRPAGSYRLAVAELLYDDALTGRAERATADVVMEFTADRMQIGVGAEARAEAELALARTARALDKCLRAFPVGDADGVDRAAALREMDRTKTLLLEQGRLAQAQQITQAMQEVGGGGSIGKTLTGVIFALNQGRTR